MDDATTGVTNTEPVSAVEVLRLAVAAGVTFGLPLSDGQQFAVFALFSALASWWVRNRVFSPATVLKKYLPKTAITGWTGPAVPPNTPDPAPEANA